VYFTASVILFTVASFYGAVTSIWMLVLAVSFGGGGALLTLLKPFLVETFHEEE
jgi:hypothetical protein